MVSARKTSSTAAPEDGLKSALEAFETSLATPVVSGELTDWLEAVEKTWAETSAQVHERIEQRHPQQFEEIGKQDLELLPRVEQLQAEDAAILADLEATATTVARYSEHVPKLEPDEEKAQQHIKKLIDEGIALVARVRKQEVAIQTWYFEAFNRDRGSVD
jgi:hypothetical protein